MEPRHAPHLRLHSLADGRLADDRRADQIRDAVEKDAEGRFDRGRHADDVERRGLGLRLRALGKVRGVGPLNAHSPDASHARVGSSRCLD